MGKKFFGLAFGLLLAAVAAQAQRAMVKGMVTDSLTGEPLPFVSLVYQGASTGGTTDAEGRFSIATPRTKRQLEVVYMGYATKRIDIAPGRNYNLDIKLVQNEIELAEVLVKPKRERYRRRDNPAVAFVKEVIARRESGDPLQHDYYTYDHYEKIVLGRNQFQQKEKARKGKLAFLADFADTLHTGTVVLPLSEREKMETVYYRKSPKSEKTVVRGHMSAGVDEILSADGMEQFLGEVFREIDIYQNNIPLFLQRFVSPLSTIGPGFYQYFLADTVQLDGVDCVDLTFVPASSESFGFNGHLYVTLDSTRFVRRAVLNVGKDINLNFISRMTVEQEFRQMPDGTRVIVKDDINVDFKLAEKSKGFYARRLNVYDNHSFLPPPDEQLAVFQKSAPVITEAGAAHRTDEFWTNARPLEEARADSNSVQRMMARLRSIPAYAITEKVLRALVSGYVPTHQDPMKNKFELGPMNSTINGNAIEGARLRLGGATTPRLSPHWFAEGYVAYGTRDTKLKYDALLEYSFVDKKDYRKEFPVHSLRFEYMYDINKLGQNYMYTSKDNVVLAIKRQRDTRATYLRRAELTYQREHYNGLSYSAALRNRREYATPFATFDRINADGSLTAVRNYDMTELQLGLRYARGEKFYQTHDQRIPITFDAWVFNVDHVMAKKGWLGTDYDYQRTDVGMRKRIWFSAFGYVDLLAKAGKVWNKVPYPLLIMPNANLTYSIQPEAYTNMNAIEFLYDEYASWDLTYYMNGLVLNRIPWIRRLKWREVVTFRGLWGHLSDKNYPALCGEGFFEFPSGTGRLGRAPYMELGVGIENIFKFLRLDYVWRLNYRDNPGIQTRGVRCTMSVSF